MARYKMDDDVEKVAEQGGFVLVPEGWLPMRLQSATTVQLTSPKTGESYEAWSVQLEVTEGEYQGQTVRDSIRFMRDKKMQARAFKFVKAFGAHLGSSLNDHIANLDTNGSQDVLIGRVAMVEIEHTQGTNKKGQPTTYANPTFMGYEPMGFVPGAEKRAASTAGVGTAPKAAATAAPPADFSDESLPF